MKKGWTYKKLGEVASFSRGLTYSKRDEVDFSENIVLRSNNIDLNTGKLDFAELKYLRSDFDIPEDKKIKSGSLFICMSNGSKAHLGKVAFVDKDYNYAYGGFMGLINPSKEIEGHYLHYILSSPRYKEFIKSLSAGANINNLKYKDLENFALSFPSIKEQKKIVSRLDAAFSHIDELKANAEKQLSSARDLFQNGLSKAMEPKDGWGKKTLPDISENLDSRRVPVTKKDRENGIYPYYGASGIVDYVNDYLFDEDLLCISEDGANLLMRTYPIAFPISGKVWVNNHAHVLRFRELTTQRFVEYYFENTILDEYITGAAQPKLTQKALNSIPVYCPPLYEQQRIVERLDALSEHVRELEEIQKKIIAECDAMKHALLRKVFE